MKNDFSVREEAEFYEAIVALHDATEETVDEKTQAYEEKFNQLIKTQPDINAIKKFLFTKTQFAENDPLKYSPLEHVIMATVGYNPFQPTTPALLCSKVLSLGEGLKGNVTEELTSIAETLKMAAKRIEMSSYKEAFLKAYPDQAALIEKNEDLIRKLAKAAGVVVTNKRTKVDDPNDLRAHLTYKLAETQRALTELNGAACPPVAESETPVLTTQAKNGLKRTHSDVENDNGEKKEQTAKKGWGCTIS